MSVRKLVCYTTIKVALCLPMTITHVCSAKRILGKVDMLGLDCNTVMLVPYSSEWPEIFQEEKRCLQRNLGPYIGDIEHIGSTAVPGIVAKPVIDILALLCCISDLERCIPLVEDLGYTYEGEQEIPGWYFFRKGQGRNTTHHLHMFSRDNVNWHKYLLFRDYLCAHRTVAAAYVALKRQLAQQFEDDRPAYTAGKAAFIQSVVEIAKKERLSWTELAT